MNTAERTIASQISQLLKPGSIVNIGIGIPSAVADWIDHSDQIILQAETGIINYKKTLADKHSNNKWVVDRQYIDASGQPVELINGGAFLSLADTFAMMRGGHIDVTVLGAYQVNRYGQLASIGLTKEILRGYGGAMDLLYGAKKVMVAMTHQTRTGESKIISDLSLPMTSLRIADVLVTELGVFQFRKECLEVLSRAPGISMSDIVARTGIPVINAET